MEIAIDLRLIMVEKAKSFVTKCSSSKGQRATQVGGLLYGLKAEVSVNYDYM